MALAMAHEAQSSLGVAEDNMEISSDAGQPNVEEELIDIDIDFEPAAEGDNKDEQMDGDDQIENQDDIMYDETRDDATNEEVMEDYTEIVDEDEELQDADEAEAFVNDQPGQDASLNQAMSPLHQITGEEATAQATSPNNPDSVKGAQTPFATDQRKISNTTTHPALDTFDSDIPQMLASDLQTAPNATFSTGDGHGSSIDSAPVQAGNPMEHGLQTTEEPAQIEDAPVSHADEQAQDQEVPKPPPVVQVSWRDAVFDPFRSDIGFKYRIEDHAVAGGSLHNLIQALRILIHDEIDEKARLDIYFDQLDIALREVSTAPLSNSRACMADQAQDDVHEKSSLADVSDIYVTLCMNDGNHDPEPLRLTVSAATPFRTRVEELYNTCSAGHGLKEVNPQAYYAVEDEVTADSHDVVEDPVVAKQSAVDNAESENAIIDPAQQTAQQSDSLHADRGSVDDEHSEPHQDSTSQPSGNPEEETEDAQEEQDKLAEVDGGNVGDESDPSKTTELAAVAADTTQEEDVENEIDYVHEEFEVRQSEDKHTEVVDNEQTGQNAEGEETQEEDADKAFANHREQHNLAATADHAVDQNDVSAVQNEDEDAQHVDEDGIAKSVDHEDVANEVEDASDDDFDGYADDVSTVAQEDEENNDDLSGSQPHEPDADVEEAEDETDYHDAEAEYEDGDGDGQPDASEHAKEDGEDQTVAEDDEINILDETEPEINFHLPGDEDSEEVHSELVAPNADMSEADETTNLRVRHSPRLSRKRSFSQHDPHSIESTSSDPPKKPRST